MQSSGFHLLCCIPLVRSKSWVQPTFEEEGSSTKTWPPGAGVRGPPWSWYAKPGQVHPQAGQGESQDSYSFASHHFKPCEVKWSEVSQLCLTLGHPLDCSLPSSSVPGILQARVLEWVAISLSSFFFPSWNYKDCLGTVKGECLLTTKASDSFVFRNLTIRSAKQPSTDSKSSNFT